MAPADDPTHQQVTPVAGLSFHVFHEYIAAETCFETPSAGLIWKYDSACMRRLGVCNLDEELPSEKRRKSTKIPPRLISSNLGIRSHGREMAEGSRMPN
jgi:hypothetical protein